MTNATTSAPTHPSGPDWHNNKGDNNEDKAGGKDNEPHGGTFVSSPIKNNDMIPPLPPRGTSDDGNDNNVGGRTTGDDIGHHCLNHEGFDCAPLDGPPLGEDLKDY